MGQQAHSFRLKLIAENSGKNCIVDGFEHKDWELKLNLAGMSQHVQMTTWIAGNTEDGEIILWYRCVCVVLRDEP